MTIDHQLADFDQLLLELYRSPLAAMPFQEFLTLLRQQLEALHATLILRPPAQGDQGVVLNAVVVSPDIYHSYNETYFALDPFVDLPAGVVMSLDEFVSSHEQTGNAYFSDYLAPINVGHILGLDLPPVQGQVVRLRLTRGVGQAPFSVSDRHWVQRLYPHLEQAIHLYERLQGVGSERALYADALDHLALGVMLIDRQLQVLQHNTMATHLLETQKGLRIVQGRLRLTDRREHEHFRTLVEEVFEAHQARRPSMVRAQRLVGREGDSDLGLLVRPLPAGGEVPSSLPSVAVFLSDPSERREAPKEVLIALFGFTPAEAQLALLLANGLTLDEASLELSVSRNTAKSHLSAVFAKTGVTRQSKLVQLILKSVATIG